MTVPNYKLLERLYEGEEFSEEQQLDESGDLKPEFEKLKEMGLISLTGSIGNLDSPIITELGIEVVLDEKRHNERINVQRMFIMITGLYTVATAGLMLKGNPSSVLEIIAWLLVGSGFLFYLVASIDSWDLVMFADIREIWRKFRQTK